MATRLEEDRIRQEQGQQFLKQLNDMFQQTRQDMEQKFVPRPELEARLDHMDQIVERIGTAVEKLTSNVGTFHESAPRVFADRVDTKGEMAELRTEIEKLKTARESDMQRGFGWRFEDVQGRLKGDMGVERALGNATSGVRKEQSSRLDQLLYVGLGILGSAVLYLLIYALQHPH